MPHENNEYDINELYRVQRQYAGTNLKIHDDQTGNKNLLNLDLIASKLKSSYFTILKSNCWETACELFNFFT
jgi:hypothetical protein